MMNVSKMIPHPSSSLELSRHVKERKKRKFQALKKEQIRKFSSPETTTYKAESLKLCIGAFITVKRQYERTRSSLPWVHLPSTMPE